MEIEVNFIRESIANTTDGTRNRRCFTLLPANTFGTFGASFRACGSLTPFTLGFGQQVCHWAKAPVSFFDELLTPRSERDALRSQNCRFLSPKEAHLEISTSGSHAVHDLLWFDFNRDCLAATRFASRSSATFLPVAKYISSGVCPRNAECGSFWLYAST